MPPAATAFSARLAATRVFGRANVDTWASNDRCMRAPSPSLRLRHRSMPAPALSSNSGILGAAEGLGFLAVAAGVVVLGFQVTLRALAQS